MAHDSEGSTRDCSKGVKVQNGGGGAGGGEGDMGGGEGAGGRVARKAKAPSSYTRQGAPGGEMRGKKKNDSPTWTAQQCH